MALGEAANPDSLFIFLSASIQSTQSLFHNNFPKRFRLNMESRKLSRALLFIVIGVVVPLMHACAQGIFSTLDPQFQNKASKNDIGVTRPNTP